MGRRWPSLPSAMRWRQIRAESGGGLMRTTQCIPSPGVARTGDLSIDHHLTVDTEFSIASKTVSNGPGEIVGWRRTRQALKASSWVFLQAHLGRLPPAGIDDRIGRTTASVVPVARTIESQPKVMVWQTLEISADTVDTTSSDMGREYDSRRSGDGCRELTRIKTKAANGVARCPVGQTLLAAEREITSARSTGQRPRPS
ncbi:hypothetical protein ACVWY3_005151 [Bradyrhizobium sp. USDA 4486]